jgi:hypothetical protein
MNTFSPNFLVSTSMVYLLDLEPDVPDVLPVVAISGILRAK